MTVIIILRHAHHVCMNNCWIFDACTDSVYQALFSPPTQKSLGMRLVHHSAWFIPAVFQRRKTTEEEIAWKSSTCCWNCRREKALILHLLTCSLCFQCLSYSLTCTAAICTVCPMPATQCHIFQWCCRLSLLTHNQACIYHAWVQTLQWSLITYNLYCLSWSFIPFWIDNYL